MRWLLSEKKRQSRLCSLCSGGSLSSFENLKEAAVRAQSYSLLSKESESLKFPKHSVKVKQE